MKKRSQALQRSFPRPHEVNVSVLRPLAGDIHLTDLQKAEELIKREMVTMLHYDALHNPPSTFSTKKCKFLARILRHFKPASMAARNYVCTEGRRQGRVVPGLVSRPLLPLWPQCGASGTLESESQEVYKLGKKECHS